MANDKDKYQEELNSLGMLFEYSRQLMLNIKEEQERVQTEWNIGQSCFAFIACFEAVGNTLSMLPGSHIRSQFENTSFTVLSSNARIVFEGMLIVAYLLSEMTEEESEFRFKVWQYHAEKKRLIIARRFDSTSERLPKLEEDVEREAEEIRNHPQYGRLEKKTSGDIIRGATDKALSKSEIEALVGFEPGYLTSTYKFLSQYSHITSYATNQINEYGIDPTAIPTGLAVVLRMMIYSYSYVIKRLVDVLEVENVPEEVRNTIDLYVDLAESFGEFSVDDPDDQPIEDQD